MGLRRTIARCTEIEKFKGTFVLGRDVINMDLDRLGLSQGCTRGYRQQDGRDGV